MLAVDFADLDSEVFGCLRADGAASAGWLSPPNKTVDGFELGGSAPALTVRGADGLDLALEPLAGPGEFGDGTQEWLCHVTGRAGVLAIDCLARVGRGPLTPAAPPRRTVSALFRPDLAFACHASGADPEAGDVEAWVLRGDGSVRVDDPRLSTAYGADGSHDRVGLELWEGEDSEFPLRLAAERVARAQFELEHVRFHCAFLRWQHDGQVGSGCYELASAAT